MKKTFFIIATALFSITLNAQSAKYTKAMEPLVAALDTTWNYDGLLALANSFQRIADAEKTQWLPYYYAAYCNVKAGYTIMRTEPSAAKLDPHSDKGETLINQAEALSKDNSEIWLVKKQIATLRLSADPMSRYMQYGPISTEALATAKRLNPENPRIYLLEGQDKYYTPEQFGGSKKEAAELFALSKQKFATFKPESSIAPHWGMKELDYFINLK